MTSRWGQDRERGAAVVEFALVVPVLLLLVLGIAEFGRAYNVQTTVSGAAREGVRAMALQNDPAAARAAAEDAASTLGLRDAQVSVSPSSCPVGAGPGVDATVTVTYRMPFVTHLFGTSGVTVTGRGVMQCHG